MKSISNYCLISTYIICIFFIANANATNGVKEINQTCATQLGCFNGDTAGFPVTINSLGSYRLTSDLILPTVNTTGISINSSNIDIDLNGFSIIGTGCFNVVSNPTPDLIMCIPASGAGYGIFANFYINNISIHNGIIMGMGGVGISIEGSSASINEMNINMNRLRGIDAGKYSHISDNTLANNGGGISALDDSIVENNIVISSAMTDITGAGIHVGNSSIVRGNTVNKNQSKGISAKASCIVQQNSVNDNGGDGITVWKGSIVKENNINNNSQGVVSEPFPSSLEFAKSYSVFENNLIVRNDSYGLDIRANDIYRGNTLLDNKDGDNIRSGFNMGDNFCDSNICP